MRYYNLIGKPISEVKFLADQIDEDYAEDWHQKAAELQERRWKKIRSHAAKLRNDQFKQHHSGSF